MNWKVFILICTVLCSCTNKNKTDQETALLEYEVMKFDNINLSGLEKDNDGFISLLSEKAFKAWRGYGKDKLPSKWKMIDGCLVLKQNGEEGGDIIFQYAFKDFELELEWKISKAGNSGIFYLAREVKAKDPIMGKDKILPIYISAPEYQILDNDNHPDAKLGKNGNRKSGSLYDMIAANPQSAKQHEEWNKTRITVKDGNVTHWLNGIKVVEYSFLGKQWIDLLQSGKFGQLKWPLAFELMKDCGGKNHEGYIGLQDHGDEVFFRNIKIKNTI